MSTEELWKIYKDCATSRYVSYDMRLCDLGKYFNLWIQRLQEDIRTTIQYKDSLPHHERTKGFGKATLYLSFEQVLSDVKKCHSYAKTLQEFADNIMKLDWYQEQYGYSFPIHGVDYERPIAAYADDDFNKQDFDWKRISQKIQEQTGFLIPVKTLQGKSVEDIRMRIWQLEREQKNKNKECPKVSTNSNNAKTNSFELSKPSGFRESSSQKDIERSYNDLLSILRDTKQNIAKLKGVNSSFNSIKQIIIENLNTQVEQAKLELSKALRETIWDNLVIGFFGETNAGKSTIIETFRILFDKNRKKEDGLIVGDGRHDFTKTYEEYKMSIGGHNFTLIDVPGIEGNESEFKDVIQTALHKAHCVFYIQGHNKKPDQATARKIKKYLGDWVKVYSIYNVRGGASNYDEEDERETLLTDGVKKAESLIQSEFKSILGDVYAGHITLQALLAMSAKATFSKQREDLIKSQQKMIKYFGGSDQVLKFSQFQTLVNLVEQKASNFKAEIVEANKQKMISLANKISDDISNTMEVQKANVDQLKDRLKTVERQVCDNYLDSAKTNIPYKSRNAINNIYGELKQQVFNLIDKGKSDIKYQVETIQRVLLNKLENRIRSIVREELSRAISNSNRKINELDGIHLDPISLYKDFDFVSEIDFSGALSELDIDFGDILGWATKTAETAAVGAGIGSVIPGVGTLIGAAVGGVIGGIAHAVSGDGGKSDAKHSVSNAIDEAKAIAQRKMENALNPILKEIEEQKKKLKNSTRQELKNIEELNNSIDSLDDEVEDFVKHLKSNRYGRI